MIQYNFTSFKL